MPKLSLNKSQLNLIAESLLWHSKMLKPYRKDRLIGGYEKQRQALKIRNKINAKIKNNGTTLRNDTFDTNDFEIMNTSLLEYRIELERLKNERSRNGIPADMLTGYDNKLRTLNGLI